MSPAVESSGSPPESLQVVCETWSREDLLAILDALKSVRTGSVEITLRERRLVGLRRKPFTIVPGKSG